MQLPANTAGLSNAQSHSQRRKFAVVDGLLACDLIMLLANVTMQYLQGALSWYWTGTEHEIDDI